MTKRTPPPDSIHPGDQQEEIRPKVNVHFWFTKFQKAMLECCLEMSKNATDWKASFVNFITNEGRDIIRYIDNGLGMNAANRLAFISVGESTAGDRQSGLFGTGAKYLIFTYASQVVVVTAPEDDPGFVYIFIFTPQELAEAYSGLGGIRVIRRRKTKETWPHEHDFGTEITYTLKDPSSRSIYRGERLAEKLSDRLDNVLIERGVVLVDGQRLPSKQLAPNSRAYIRTWQEDVLPHMGRVRFEFYRPANFRLGSRASNEDLRMTDRSIGEVSFRDMLVKHLLTDEQRAMVPALFSEPEVCGLITADFLHHYVSEQRDRYDPSVADDERLNELLRMLARCEADVAEHLGIKLQNAPEDETTGRAEAEDLLERLQRRYNPEGLAPPGYAPIGDPDETVVTDPPIKEPTERNPSVPQPRLLINRQEFALDEDILIELRLPAGMDATDWHFFVKQAHAKVIHQTTTQLMLRASELGNAFVSVHNNTTLDELKVEYDVVTERRFHLSARGPNAIHLGSTFTVQALNADLLKGNVEWKLEGGRGQLTVLSKGLAARLSPTATGRFVIRASDSKRRSTYDICDLRVLPPPGEEQRTFRIRDQFFLPDWKQLSTRRWSKPATIQRAGDGEVHRLVFNMAAPGYVAAHKNGTLAQVLAYAIAEEFVKEFVMNWDELEKPDFYNAVGELQIETAILVEEMLQELD